MHFDPDGVKTYYTNSGMIPCSRSGRDELAKTGSDSDRKVIAYLDTLQKDIAAPRYPGRPTKRDRRKLEDFLSEP